MRVKSSTITRRKRKKLFKKTKGMIKSRRASVRRAKEAVLKAESYAYRDRRTKKRDLRSLWIVRLNAALRAEGLNYSRFIKILKDQKVELNRRTLAELAAREPETFKTLVAQLKK